MTLDNSVGKVVIAGAGLGGLVAALALRKQGIDAQIYEKARELRPVGAGLSLAPNGLNTLEKIVPGIITTLKSLGNETHYVAVRKSNGDLLVKNRLTHFEKYQQPLLDIRWSSLQETLASFLPSDIIHLNARVFGFKQNNNAVEVQFDNSPPVTADLLVGADGISSAVRDILLGDGPPRYAGRMSWRAVIKYDDRPSPPNEATMMTGPDGKVFAWFDVGGGFIFWSAASLASEDSVADQTTTAKQRVQQIFSDWAPALTAMLEATPADDIVERPICDRLPATRWSHGRVTLLGDAAHAMVPALGQGANTAFEDAWELSRALARTPDVEAALASYDKSRTYRTQIIQARSALQGSRSYGADGETFLAGVIAQASATQSEFEDWLYSYDASAFD